MFDTDAFEERAAIMEYDGGMSRFQAETLAAKAQGLSRWQALQEVENEKHQRNSERGGDNRQTPERHNSDNVSRMQPRAPQQERPMPERVVSAGWGGLALLALFVQGGPIL